MGSRGGRRDYEADGLASLPQHGARFAVAQDAQRDDPCLATTRKCGEYRLKSEGDASEIAGFRAAVLKVRIHLSPAVSQVRTRAGVRVESGDSAFGLSQTDVTLASFNGEGPFDAAGPL